MKTVKAIFKWLALFIWRSYKIFCVGIMTGMFLSYFIIGGKFNFRGKDYNYTGLANIIQQDTVSVKKDSTLKTIDSLLKEQDVRIK